MVEILGTPSRNDLNLNAFHNLRTIYWNLYPPDLVEHIVRRKEGILAHRGALVVNTGKYTGRSPNDKFIVRNSEHKEAPIWWGKTNQPIAPRHFETLFQKMVSYFQGRELFIQDMVVGAHPLYRLPIRIITEKAWHSLFSRNLFIRIPSENLPTHVPRFTIIHAPGFEAVPAQDGTNSKVFIIIDFDRRLVLIGGTDYAGEIKKSVFTVMNFLMPQKHVLSMHCSANIGVRGDAALFFGLSGTGKTTLSSDPERKLIGDDEHGWDEEGIFNIEGGCYAKTIHLRPDLEPLIWEAAHQFGTILENVTIDPLTRVIDFDDASLTENTRAAYPIDFLPNVTVEGFGDHPENIFFLTADAFGVLPPISALTQEQAMYYFLSGYTAKIAGTEKGLGCEPQSTFSTCFGAPFLPLNPNYYAQLLGEKIKKYQTRVWLVNTGWTGGPYGIGLRIALPYTRAIIRAALNHQLDSSLLYREPYFGLLIPTTCPGVPSEILDPCRTWSDSAAYVNEARKLVDSFIRNFSQFASSVPPEVRAAGPSRS
jgi:phosphoenolpyruvate carboxykinase (ATP)